MRSLLVGRFQPFHRGHLALVGSILAGRSTAPLLLAIGSADESFTWKNPFTAGERFEMMERALADRGRARISIVPVADIHRHSQWVRHLETLLPPFDRIYTNNPLTRLLFERAGYPVDSPKLVDRRRFEGEHIRRCLARGTGWRPLVPPAVADYLESIEGPRRLAMLRSRDTPRARGTAP